MGIEIKDDVILTKLENKIGNIQKNKDTMLAIQSLFKDYMTPFVPMKEGILAGHTAVTSEYVHYLEEYAHYMYIGEVYGPNYPIDAEGKINFDKNVPAVEWRSPKSGKYPTGRAINYSTSMHPLATHHWDKAMMRAKGDAFKIDVGKIIMNSIKKGAK